MQILSDFIKLFVSPLPLLIIHKLFMLVFQTKPRVPPDRIFSTACGKSQVTSPTESSSRTSPFTPPSRSPSSTLIWPESLRSRDQRDSGMLKAHVWILLLYCCWLCFNEIGLEIYWSNLSIIGDLLFSKLLVPLSVHEKFSEYLQNSVLWTVSGRPGG